MKKGFIEQELWEGHTKYVKEVAQRTLNAFQWGRFKCM